MAQSPSHKFGQIIGNLLEIGTSILLNNFVKKHNVYLDMQGERNARRGKKVTWTDLNGNKHDLDFVFERGGTDDIIGTPVAFIETAWRRYTRHSKNKVQEIQGAIQPLLETYWENQPFVGVIAAGEFTGTSLAQLRSLGFEVLYIPYENVVAAFNSFKVDAYFDENTSDKKAANNIKQIDKLTPKQQVQIANKIINSEPGDLNNFLKALKLSLKRRLKSIRILPLHGNEMIYNSLVKAITFIKHFDEEKVPNTFERYEVEAFYSNGDHIKGEFNEKEGAITFLQKLEY